MSTFVLCNLIASPRYSAKSWLRVLFKIHFLKFVLATTVRRLLPRVKHFPVGTQKPINEITNLGKTSENSSGKMNSVLSKKPTETSISWITPPGPLGGFPFIRKWLYEVREKFPLIKIRRLSEKNAIWRRLAMMWKAFWHLTWCENPKKLSRKEDAEGGEKKSAYRDEHGTIQFY